MRRVEDLGEPVVGLSYSQLRCFRLRGYCEIEDRRVLVFCAARVLLSVHADSFLPLLYMQEGRILYGSFISDHRPNNFVVVCKVDSRFLIRTYSIVDDHANKDAPASISKEKSVAWRRLEKENPLFFYELARLNHKKMAGSGSQASTGSESGIEARLENEREVEALRGQEAISCFKVIKNIVCGQTELILSAGKELVTVMLRQHTVLLISAQKIEGPARAVEHWGGYYFVLYHANRLGVYKRAPNGDLSEARTLVLLGPKDPIVVEDIRLPALEWSDRLVNVLSNEFPVTALLLGKSENSGNVVMKYDVVRGKMTMSCEFGEGKTVTAIGYGPYDNGPVLVGLGCGKLLALDYYTFVPLFQLDLNCEEAVRWITYDPCNTLIVGTERSIHTCCLTDGEDKVETEGECIKITIKQH